MKKIASVYKFLIYILPGVLFFSYYPLISLGGNGSMNFELSLPLLWLVVFDFVAFIILVKKKLIAEIWKNWPWLLFPIFVTISALWSLNFLRGVLTVGILWLIYFAIFAFWNLRKLFSEKGFLEKFWKVFFASSLAICIWCFVQCILDLVGVSREVSLMCAGCTYEMFGFPHPNGFAIEPQFMGNLLLAPVVVSGILVATCPSGTFRATRAKSLRPAEHIATNIPLKRWQAITLFFVFAATLFLTFSRGAIYAFGVAMIFMTVMEIVKTKKWKALLIWPVIILAFLFTLNLQGIMSEVSATNDTYGSGVAKALNHLSLGVIDIREGNHEEKSGEMDAPVSEEKEAEFSGYVEESTNTRLRLTNAALSVWKKDFGTAMFGVGIGGAGQALYVNNLSPAPKEIVQNEYASLLMEIGLVGVALFILTIVLIARVAIKNEMVLTLIVAYAVTLLFFSGLPNVLHIYLLPALFIILYGKSSYRK